MFRKSNNQGSLLEVDVIFKGALPENDWSYTYKDNILPLIDEDKFKHLFAEVGGSPNKPVKLTLSLLIFMGIEKYNWRQAEFQLPRRLDWLNATCTPLGKGQIDHSTLFKFFQKLENDETSRNLFVTITNKCMKLCGTSPKKQRTDSFFIYGWLRTLSRYGLFKETIKVFLSELKKKNSGNYERISNNLSKKYLEKDFDLTEKDHDKAKRRVKEMAKDMYLLIHEFEKNDIVNKFNGYKTLTTVFKQQCIVLEKDTARDAIEIEIREKPEGEKIISTPHNPDSEYVAKGKQKVIGKKGFITETCGDENNTQFITDVNVTEATKADSKELPKIQDRLEESDNKPEEQYCDAGFVNGKTILKSKKDDINLEGPSSGRSQSLEDFNKEDRPLDIADFDVSIDESTKEASVVKCPEGQIPKDQTRSNKTGKINAHFNAEQCKSCPSNHRCPIKIGKKTATLTLDENGIAGAQRHHKYMTQKEYRKQCAVRAGAEAVVNELANAHGMRKAKHRTSAKIQLQMIFAAIGCNIKRFIKHGDTYAYSIP